MKKKKVLFVYPAMNIGGSTTSLLSILNRLDYNKYEVDLLLNIHAGELLDMIPEQVHLLAPAYKYTNRRQEYFHRFISPRFLYHYSVAKIIAKRSGAEIQAAQYIGYKDLDYYRDIEQLYDVAISFLEGRCCKFIANHIKASKKITWIHINYADVRLNPKYDAPSLSKMDNIVFVSDDCKKDFDRIFPKLKSKSIIIENILATEYIKMMAKESLDFTVNQLTINLVTVCRVSFKSKGLDRAVVALSKLKQENRLKDICWYIIGDGSDMQTLKSMISEAGLDDYIKPLGMKKNPYPYLKNMDMFFLPSRWEGKPMVVTEAFMLGLPALVTEYSSAREQVRDGVDGIIVDNSEEGIYKGLKRIIENPELITELHNNVIKTDYSNVEEIKKVEQLIDG